MNSENIQKINPDLLAKLEAILFVHGEQMNVAKIAAFLKIPETELAEYIEALQNELARSERGLSLLESSGAFQLTTKPEFGNLLETMLAAELNEDLTPVALETLAIIGYGGPLRRADIDYIRGVNSSFIVRALTLRGLIDRALDPHRGNSFIYMLSAACLRHLGLMRIANLPEYEKFRTIARQMGEGAKVTAAPLEAAAVTPPRKVEDIVRESNT